jgi:hypothetical protein
MQILVVFFFVTPVQVVTFLKRKRPEKKSLKTLNDAEVKEL